MGHITAYNGPPPKTAAFKPARLSFPPCASSPPPSTNSSPNASQTKRASSKSTESPSAIHVPPIPNNSSSNTNAWTVSSSRA